MKKFGSVDKCEACGCKADFQMVFKSSATYKVDGSKENTSHIERTCPRCGFIWKEKPLYLCDDGTTTIPICSKFCHTHNVPSCMCGCPEFGGNDE